MPFVLLIHTATELFYGAARSRTPTENRELVTVFLATLRMIGLDRLAVERFGLLKADLERNGQRLADADLLIASITPARGATLITGNRRHYERIAGLSIEDWIRG